MHQIPGPYSAHTLGNWKSGREVNEPPDQCLVLGRALQSSLDQSHPRDQVARLGPSEVLHPQSANLALSGRKEKGGGTFVRGANQVLRRCCSQRAWPAFDSGIVNAGNRSGQGVAITFGPGWLPQEGNLSPTPHRTPPAPSRRIGRESRRSLAGDSRAVTGR